MKKRVLAAAAVLLTVIAVWAVMQKESAPPGVVPPDHSINQPGAAPEWMGKEKAGGGDLQEPPDREKNGHGVYPGDRAYDFELVDLEGNTVKLSDFQDRVVLLCFWQTTSSWCLEEMPLLDQLYKAYKDGDVTVLAVNVGEEREEVSEFFREKGLTIPVLLDTEAKTAKNYLVSYLPTNFIINRRGEISAVHIGLVEYDQMVGYVEDAFKE